MIDLKDYIAEVKNWPIEGVSFKDVTPLLGHGEAFSAAIDALSSVVKTLNPDVIVSPEARGFIFGGAVAAKLKIPFVLVRKAGKLPRRAIQEDVVLEYGTTQLFMHDDAIKKGQKVVILDDVLATGGTSLSIAKLVERLGGTVQAFTFLINLSYLPGQQRLMNARYDVQCVLTY